MASGHSGPPSNDPTDERETVCQDIGRVAVIGGGPAGSAAATRLAHRGAEVTLFERAEFPREKVCGCCLGAAGLAALDAIGVGQSVRELGRPTKFFHGYFQTSRGGTQETRIHSTRGVRIPIVQGTALSRSQLDLHLLRWAEQAGVNVQQPCGATIVSQDPSGVWVESEPGGSQRYDLVVIATGLTGKYRQAGTAELAWKQTPHGPMGISTHLPRNVAEEMSWQLEDGEIQMHCGEEGYAGVVQLPSGDLDIAAAVHVRHRNSKEDHSGKRAIEAAVKSLLLNSNALNSRQSDRLRQWFAEGARWQTTPALRRKRVAGNGRVVAIGDAAGYVEPLTGEGMTWGIESGLAVADLWDSYQSGRIPADKEPDFGAHWHARATKFQTRRRRLCGWVTGWVRYRPARWLARGGLQRAGWLAAPFTRSLAIGPRFESTSTLQRPLASIADASHRTHSSL